ncbi:MAG: phage major capsid protein [Clostridia bacterium]|nr:phage major capsid protein [Clostridia bacterium]
MTINELRTKRAKAWEAAKAFLDSHRNDKGVLSAEDDATYARMENDISELGKEIARMERLEAMDMEMSKPVSTPIIEKPEAPKMETKVGRASDDYKKAFWNHARKRDSYEVRNALQIGTDSEGGYLVPDTFEKTLITALEAENVIRKHAHVFTTSHGSHKIPVVSTRGTAAWVDEEGQIPESDDAFGQQLIGAHKVATLIKVSEELLNDSAFDLEGYFTKEFARRIGNAEEAAFLSGNGTGKPTGILAGVGGAEIGITAASETAITADEIIDLFYSLKSPYRKNAIWVLNDSTIKAIRKLKDHNGQYLWQPALRDGEYDTILGKRIFTSPYAPEIGAGAKSIAFGDFSYYWIGDRQGVSFKRLNERFAETGQVGFIATKRVDAKLILPEAIKVLQQKGTAAE